MFTLRSADTSAPSRAQALRASFASAASIPASGTALFTATDCPCAVAGEISTAPTPTPPSSSSTVSVTVPAPEKLRVTFRPALVSRVPSGNCQV